MDDKKETAIRRGQQAQRLLEDPLMAEALATLFSQYFTAWAASDPADVPQREQLHAQFVALSRVKRHLETVMADGRLADAQIDEARGRQPFNIDQMTAWINSMRE